MRGADLVIEALLAAEVKTIFTLSGNQIMPVFDACIGTDMRLIHVRHEAAAVYMADAWAQLSGRPGVALVTAAPGFTNCLTGIYSARAAESPVLLLSGDSPLQQDGRGAFQELDQVSISRSLVKHAKRCVDAATLRTDVAAAIQTACSARPGPVHLALPFDVLNERPAKPQSLGSDPFSRVVRRPDRTSVDQLIRHLSRASRPIVLTGPEMTTSRAPEMIRLLEACLDLPVVPMESPRGLKDPMLGDFSKELGTADLVLFLGKGVDFTVNFARPPALAPGCDVIVVDAESEALERARRNLDTRLLCAIEADALAAAEALVQQSPGTPQARKEWRAAVAAAIAARDYKKNKASPASNRIKPEALCRAVQRVLGSTRDSVLICDGGEFGQWSQACTSSPTRIINGLGGAIGGVLCYGVAAKLHSPQATVVSLMGDGTAGFHLSEFETAVRYDLPFVAVIGNDARWNAEHQIQLRDYGPERLIGCDLSPTRYDLAVAGLGGHGEYVTDPLELDDAINRAIESGLPACINVEIDGLPAPAGAGH